MRDFVERCTHGTERMRESGVEQSIFVACDKGGGIKNDRKIKKHRKIKSSKEEGMAIRGRSSQHVTSHITRQDTQKI